MIPYEMSIPPSPALKRALVTYVVYPSDFMSDSHSWHKQSQTMAHNMLTFAESHQNVLLTLMSCDIQEQQSNIYVIPAFSHSNFMYKHFKQNERKSNGFR